MIACSRNVERLFVRGVEPVFYVRELNICDKMGQISYARGAACLSDPHYLLNRSAVNMRIEKISFVC